MATITGYTSQIDKRPRPALVPARTYDGRMT